MVFALLWFFVWVITSEQCIYIHLHTLLGNILTVACACHINIWTGIAIVRHLTASLLHSHIVSVGKQEVQQNCQLNFNHKTYILYADVYVCTYVHLLVMYCVNKTVHEVELTQVYIEAIYQ